MDQPGAPGIAAPPRRSRRGLVIALVLVALLVLGGGGGLAAFLVLRDSGGEAQSSPEAAATKFLDAVYKAKDPTKASRYVCAAARDKGAIKRKVDEVRGYEQKFNRDPQFTFETPRVESRGKETAKLAVTIRFSSSDDRVAEQKLTMTAVNDDGWYVCDIQSGP